MEIIIKIAEVYVQTLRGCSPPGLELSAIYERVPSKFFESVCGAYKWPTQSLCPRSLLCGVFLDWPWNLCLLRMIIIIPSNLKILLTHTLDFKLQNDMTGHRISISISIQLND